MTLTNVPSVQPQILQGLQSTSLDADKRQSVCIVSIPYVCAHRSLLRYHLALEYAIRFLVVLCVRHILLLRVLFIEIKEKHVSMIVFH